MSAEHAVTPVPLHGPLSRPSERPSWLRAPERGGGSQAQLRQPGRILIVEDDLLIASQMEAALAEAGFEVTATVTTGEEAIEIARARAPDLAVVDIRLAGHRSGVDTALELFRAHNIRCIFASAFADREARRRAEPAAPLGWLQ